MSGRTVDVHAHAIIGAVEALVADSAGLHAQRELDAVRNGAASLAVSGRMVRDRIPQLTDLSRRLADMDATGIDVQVVSPSPSQYHYWADEELAGTVCRTASTEIAALVARAPDRLRGLGLVPLQHPSTCPDLLDHAVLDCGLQGVEISTHAPRDSGHVDLSDPALEPFWTRAEELGAAVFVHPFGCTLDARLDQFYLSNVVGQPVESAVALSHLVFSGVLDRHPGLVLIIAHGGGYLPTSIGRSDHAWRTRTDAHSCAELPSSYLRRVYYDGLVHSADALRALVAAVGADRVLLGSDYPFDMGYEDPLAALASAGLDQAQTDAIASGNAAFLLSPTLHQSPR
jgi:aminocarboxymuconate-semialdehyde decarboxylase